jgi:SNF2 family DNA or RNA helicase
MNIRNYRFKTKPYEHQLVALEKSWDKKEFAYLMEMGTGKSKVLIDNIAILYDKGLINGALIIAPKGVYKNWFSLEIPTHLSSHIQHKTVLWTTSTSKTKQEELNSLYKSEYNLHVLVMNVEALSTKNGAQFAYKFLNTHKTLMAVDESTTIKNHKAKRTEYITLLAKSALYRRILTGSPITKSPLDLYSQCYFLNENLLGFSSYYTFRSRYADMVERVFSGRRVKIIRGYQKLDELSELLESFSYRVLKEDCLDLPPKVYVKRDVELTDEQLKLYSTMKAIARSYYNGKELTAVNALSQLLRLHQITCGHFVSDTGEIQSLKNNRIPELLKILEEVEGKVIIWATYVNDIKSIYEAISTAKDDEENIMYGEESIVTYYGATDDNVRQDNIKNFQDPNSKVRFFIGNPQTGGYGITLTAANTVVYYSNSYDLEKRLQSEDRAHRIGQKKSVTYIDLIAEKTVDEKILNALKNKVDIAATVLNEEIRNWLD